jgi:hypothetical protein
MAPRREPPVIKVEPRYIDGAKLSQLLARLFRREEYAAEVSRTDLMSWGKAFSKALMTDNKAAPQIRRGKWIIKTPIPLTRVCIRRQLTLLS